MFGNALTGDRTEALGEQGRDFLDDLDELVVGLDAEGRVTFVNSRVREALGYDADELVGRDWFETCVPARERADLRTRFERSLAGGDASLGRHENPVLTSDGTERRVRWQNTVLRDGDGTATGTLSAGTDVTGEVAGDEAGPGTDPGHPAPPDQYATFVEEATDGIAVVRDGEFGFVNERFAEFLGTTREALVGAPFHEHVDPAYRDLVRAHHGRRRGDDPGRYEIEVGDGARTLEVDATRIEYEGRPASLAVARDVTDRKRRQRELERAKGRYRTLVEQFPNGVVTLFDEDLRYRLVGGDGLDRLDVSTDDLEGRRLDEVFPPENAAALEPLYERALDGESSTTEVSLEDRWFRVRVVPVRGQGGEVFAGMTMSQDVTEEKARQRELETARRRYRTLLQAAPVPIFVANADTGEIVEANAAAADLRGQPREELVGLDQSELHPDDGAYRQLFEEHVAEGGTKRRLPDGSPIYAVDADGERTPVEISVETIPLDGERVVYGVFRDVSEHHEYERALAGLNEASRDLFEVETPLAVGEHVAETAATLLDRAGAVVYRFDTDQAALRPVAHASSSAADPFDDLPTLDPGEHAPWRVFTGGGSEAFDDAGGTGLAALRSGLAVALGDWGVLVVGSREPDAFDGRAVDLVETLAATAEAALERAEWERHLSQRERELERRTRQLEEAESLNGQLRSVARALADAGTRGEIERAVCTHLVEAEPFAFAWVGALDRVEERLDPRAQAGESRGYLETVSLSLDGAAASEPAVRAARDHEQVSVPDAATDVAREPWRGEAVSRGFRSVLSVPLVYRESLQGVLTVYGATRSAFAEPIRSVLSELGDLVAHALASLARTEALVSNQTTELEFDVRERECFLSRAARETGATLELEGVIPQADEAALVFVRVREGAPEALLAAAERAPAVERARLVEPEGDPLVQFRFVRPFVATRLAEHGISVRAVAADEGGCRMTVAVPPTLDVWHAVEVVSSLYPDAELLAKRERAESLEAGDALAARVFERLTDRQRHVAEVAYRNGYFDAPRRTSSAELAAELDFSTSAFHDHIRTFERKVVETVFETGTPELTGLPGSDRGEADGDDDGHGDRGGPGE